MKTIITAAVVLGLAMEAPGSDFYAYYTKLAYDRPQEPALLGEIPVHAAKTFAGGQADQADLVPRPPRTTPVRWGAYSDLVVCVAKGRRLVFSRATGYLPYLQTPKGKFPLRKLVECKPDPMCLCSYVRLVENSADRIVVHWRHVPDPARVVMTETIQEYFLITPDGRARREVYVGRPRLRHGGPSPGKTQVLNLTADGIAELSVTGPTEPNAPAPAVVGSPVRPNAVGRPAAWLKFDDGLRPSRDWTRETVTGTACPVAGNTTLWKKGVSGTALAFDGYFSKVTLPKDKAPAVRDELTLEAWVVLGANPWNDAGVVHCSAGLPIRPQDYKHGYRDPYTYRPWKMKGYLLGVDPYGRAVFKANGEQVGGGELPPDQTPRKADVMPRYRWTHLAATYGRGKMCLYVNGKPVASKPASGPIALPDRDVLIGLNGDAQRISDPVSHSKFAANNNLPLVYGIEGLIDEVRIYSRALSPSDIRKSYQALCPSGDEAEKPDLEKRILPGAVDGRPARSFGATCRTLKFHELWDNLWRPSRYRDIVVRFDNVPCSVVFWQGTNFGSSWVTENNKWMSDQSWEIGGPHGCAEHMADKRGRFNRVRLIENTDARVVVQWRYASIDVGYVFPSTGVWADEYYAIYPDGVGVRWVAGIRGGWQDTQFLSQPGTTCLDNIDLTAFTVANLDGRSAELTWKPPRHVPKNPIPDACIKRINFKSEWKVFAIHQQAARVGTWGAGEQSKHTPDPFAGPWNHWPVGLNPSDGRYAVSDDRVTHAALGGARNNGEYILYGFTRKPAASLATLGRSWNRPPAVADAKGCKNPLYDPAQRAFVLTATGKLISFTVRASKNSPIVNPCFVISDWPDARDASVTINGRAVSPGKRFRRGVVRDTAGQPRMILYLELESTSPTRVDIAASVRAQPAG